VDFGGNGKVTVTLPNLEGSGTGRESVYQGQRKPHQKECVLIFNHETGELVLEKLNTAMIVKKARLRQEDLAASKSSLNAINNNNNSIGINNNKSSLTTNGHSAGPAKSSIHNDKVSVEGEAGPNGTISFDFVSFSLAQTKNSSLNNGKSSSHQSMPNM